MAKGKLTDDGWQEVPAEDPPFFRAPPKKLKLLADAQVPTSVIREIRAAGIVVSAIEKAARSSPDPAILKLAQEQGRVLLTLDGDFWDDRRYSLQSVQNGIIFVDESPARLNQILRAFGFVYAYFAKSYPLDRWEHMKVRATLGEFQVKMRTWRGSAERYRVKLRDGRPVMKKG